MKERPLRASSTIPDEVVDLVTLDDDDSSSQDGAPATEDRRAVEVNKPELQMKKAAEERHLK